MYQATRFRSFLSDWLRGSILQQTPLNDIEQASIGKTHPR